MYYLKFIAIISQIQVILTSNTIYVYDVVWPKSDHWL